MAMASSSLCKELSCSICLSMYKNPVMLACGHNFCKNCIEHAWDRQRTSRIYTCPECREEFTIRPVLQKNLKLGNIVECYLSVSDTEHLSEGDIFCTYCVVSQVPAVKTCIHCEASLCLLHLSKHSQSVNHVLIEPTAGLEDCKCPDHNELIKYFCIQDSSPLCMTCTMNAKHKGHNWELLSEASERKRLGLYEFTKKLTLKTEETENLARRVEDYKRKVQEKAGAFKDRVADLFGDIREKLNKLENQVLCEISKQEEEVSNSCSQEIQKLDKEINELYKKKVQIQQTCKLTNPLALLRQNIATDVKSVGIHVEKLDEELLDVITMNALYRLMHAIPLVKEECGFDTEDSADLMLNVNTANHKLSLSYDLKEAWDSGEKQKLRPHLPERFYSQQVLSTKRISSGKHYWEIEAGDDGNWSVGVTYNSVKKSGYFSQLGKNHKSWCISWCDLWDQLYIQHDNEREDLYKLTQDIGIYLDYEAGIVSFYDLSDTVEHLHTFHHRFTEPLYFGIHVDEAAVVRILR